jgi:hypothetical protein
MAFEFHPDAIMFCSYQSRTHLLAEPDLLWFERFQAIMSFSAQTLHLMVFAHVTSIDFDNGSAMN